MFRDFDSDQSYGIPVCSGCGGLGFRLEANEAFQRLVDRVFHLRFTYCPIDNLPDPFPGAKLDALEALVATVRELYEAYGNEAECFAKQIVNGSLDARIVELRDQRDRELDLVQSAELDPEASRTELSRAAIVAATMNRLEEADRLYAQLLEELPDSSIARHDFGTYLVQFRRDAEGALEHFKASCEMQPVKALHFVQTAQCLVLLERAREAMNYLVRARGAPDFHLLRPDVRSRVLSAVS